MAISYRFFEDESDLDLQYEFWIKITKNLPYVWKPTKSPRQYRKQEEFHPKTRCFAFDGDRIVGYMSFTGAGTFVSFGYPWSLPEYEDQIREELWNRVFLFAKDDYGAKQFLQRFRQEWTSQIDFFESKGFKVTMRQPIYIMEVPDNFEASITEIDDRGYDTSWYLDHLQSSGKIDEMTLNNFKMYLDSVDFDFGYNDKENGNFMGVTCRMDNGFSELIVNHLENKRKYREALSYVIRQLNERGISQLGITIQENDPNIEFFNELGFDHKSGDVYVGMDL